MSLERVSYDRESYTDYSRVGSRIDKKCNSFFFITYKASHLRPRDTACLGNV